MLGLPKKGVEEFHPDEVLLFSEERHLFLMDGLNFKRPFRF